MAFNFIIFCFFEYYQFLKKQIKKATIKIKTISTRYNYIFDMIYLNEL